MCVHYCLKDSVLFVGHVWRILELFSTLKEFEELTESAVVIIIARVRGVGGPFIQPRRVVTDGQTDSFKTNEDRAMTGRPAARPSRRLLHP